MNTHTGIHDKGDQVRWNGIAAKIVTVSESGDDITIELTAGDELFRIGEVIAIGRHELDTP